jgi:hypothetical protein
MNTITHRNVIFSSKEIFCFLQITEFHLRPTQTRTRALFADVNQMGNEVEHLFASGIETKNERAIQLHFLRLLHDGHWRMSQFKVLSCSQFRYYAQK